MSRRWWVGLIAIAALTGCTSGWDQDRGESADLERQYQQAHDALGRYDKAFAAANLQQVFMVIGEPVTQVGAWEPANTWMQRSLQSGWVAPTDSMAGNGLSQAPRPMGTVTWDGGRTSGHRMLSALDALRGVRATATEFGHRDEVLRVTGARLTTMRVQTTRGAATAPAWEYTLEGTTVRLLRVAVAPSIPVAVTPPSWDPYNAPVGLSIDSAVTTSTSTEMTVAFTGSKSCGADYTAEAVESTNAVVVMLVNHRHGRGAGTLEGYWCTTTVKMARPLGERAVLTVQTGSPVPVAVRP